MLGHITWCVGLITIGLWRLRRKRNSRRGPRARVLSRNCCLATTHPDEVSILSWNILADHLASNQQLAYIHPDHLNWEHRRKLIQDELAAVQADIVCLQEVEAIRWEEVCSWLPGYSALLQDRAKDASILNAIFYKPRLQLAWSEHRSRTMLAEFAFENSNGNTQVFHVVNCHLEGSPYRPMDRVSQMRSALQRLQQRQQQQGWAPQDCSVIIVGDFNSGRADSVWRLLIRGRLEGGSTESYLPRVEVTRTTVSHPYLFHDVYTTADAPLPFTRKVPQLASTLDFVIGTADLRVCAVYQPIGDRHMGLVQRCHLPNQLYPSDHLPVGAVLRTQPWYAWQAAEHDLHEQALKKHEHEEQQQQGHGHLQERQEGQQQQEVVQQQAADVGGHTAGQVAGEVGQQHRKRRQQQQQQPQQGEQNASTAINTKAPAGEPHGQQQPPQQQPPPAAKPQHKHEHMNGESTEGSPAQKAQATAPAAPLPPPPQQQEQQQQHGRSRVVASSRRTTGSQARTRVLVKAGAASSSSGKS